jgi:hypothetical protein
VLEHIGAHLLFDTSLDTSLELCGLCFRPSPPCIFYLRKGKGPGTSQQVDIQKSHCPNLIKAFSYHSAAVESSNSPCTNVPLICPSAHRPQVLYGNTTCRLISKIATRPHRRPLTQPCSLFPDQNEPVLQTFGLNDMRRSETKKEQ